MSRELVRKKIKAVKDFPEEGRIYYDITSMLSDAKALRFVIDEMINYFVENDLHFDKIVSAESRGFIFGAAVAYKLGAGFVPVRKKGKLPYKTHQVTYELEYGTDTLEIHQDAVRKGENVLIVDDLLATGGTAKAVAELVEKVGGKIAGIAFLIELKFLKGREKIKSYPLFTIIEY